MRYPFLDLKTVNEPLMAALKEAACLVVESGRYIGGDEVEDFEKELAAKTQTAFAVGTGNGLDALKLIFKAYLVLGHLKAGDKVIVPANTYIASALALTDVGLEPLFVDVDPRTMNIDTYLLKETLASGPKAILTVHLYGRPCFDERLRSFAEENGLIIVEDNAQAIGAEAMIQGLNGTNITGGLGHAAAFSFYPTKNIGALGDAGAVTTNDPTLAATIRALANYGSETRYHNIYEGYNSRLDPIQAAMLRVKLPTTDAENNRRRAVAAVYDKNIVNPVIRKPLMSHPDNCVWHQYVICCKDRDRLRNHLTSEGVGTDINYPTPVHLQPCYSRFSCNRLPVAERLSKELLCLPISACTSEDDARAIAAIINEF